MKQAAESISTIDWEAVRVYYDAGRTIDECKAKFGRISRFRTPIDAEGLSMRECLTRFGSCRATWAEAVRRGEIVPRPAKVPIERLLVRDRQGTSRGDLKRRLIREGFKEGRREECGISEWRGRRPAC